MTRFFKVFPVIAILAMAFIIVGCNIDGTQNQSSGLEARSSFLASESSSLLDLDFDGSAVDGSGNNLPVLWKGIESYQSGSAVCSAASDSYILVPHTDVLGNTDQLSITIVARKTGPASESRLVNKHRQYALAVGEKSVSGYIKNDRGELVRVAIYNFQSVNDSEWHEYKLTYDGSLVALTVDGVIVDSKPFSGTVNNDSAYDLYIGKHPWRDAFNGEIDRVEIRSTVSDTETPADPQWIWNHSFREGNEYVSYPSRDTVLEEGPDGSLYVGYTSINPQEEPILGTPVNDLSSPNGMYDYYVTKIDPETGETLWTYVCGGSGNDRLRDVAVSSEGNLYLIGQSFSDDIDPMYGENSEGVNLYIVKLDAQGRYLWDAMYYGLNTFESVQDFSVEDDKLLISAYVGFWDESLLHLTGDYRQNSWERRGLAILSFSSEGVWQETYIYGGATMGIRRAIQTSDGGYALAGFIRARTFDTTYGSIQYDLNTGYLLKIGSDFVPEWDAAYGDNIILGLTELSDGSMVFGLSTQDSELTADMGVNHIQPGQRYVFEMYVVRVQANGREIWTALYGGDQNDTLCDIRSDSDDRIYLSAGYGSGLDNVDFGEPSRYGNGCLIELNTAGSIVRSGYLDLNTTDNSFNQNNYVLETLPVDGSEGEFSILSSNSNDRWAVTRYYY